MVRLASEVPNSRADPSRESVLRRQTATIDGANAGSGFLYRLDPATLPIFHAAPAGGPGGEASFILDRERVVLKRMIRTGAPMMATVPVADYVGVAVRMAAVDSEGTLRVTVELLHNDPSLTVRLAVAEEPETVAADWQAWGNVLKLPLLIVEQDGTVGQPLMQLGGLVANPVKPRRHHSFFADRRPRFLTRRKKGGHDRGDRVTGREIIARD